jgi:hypothetical protein
MPKTFLENHLDSKILKIALFVMFSIGFIVLLPLAIVLAPFIFAWSLTKSLTKNKKQNFAYNMFDGNNKINDLVFEFDNWFNNSKGND